MIKMSRMKSKITQYIKQHKNANSPGERQPIDTDNGITQMYQLYVKTVIKTLKRAILKT